MTVEEIQRTIRALHRDSQERATPLRQMRERNPQVEAELQAIFEELQSRGLTRVRPGPGRTAVALARFSWDEQRQIEAYSRRLIDEAQALCLRLQDLCPTLTKDDRDVDGLYRFERWYRAQLHAMDRLRRRCDSGHWISAHVRKARRWLQGAQVESVN